MQQCTQVCSDREDGEGSMWMRHAALFYSAPSVKVPPSGYVLSCNKAPGLLFHIPFFLSLVARYSLWIRYQPLNLFRVNERNCKITSVTFLRLLEQIIKFHGLDNWMDQCVSHSIESTLWFTLISNITYYPRLKSEEWILSFNRLLLAPVVDSAHLV